MSCIYGAVLEGLGCLDLVSWHRTQISSRDKTSVWLSNTVDDPKTVREQLINTSGGAAFAGTGSDVHWLSLTTWTKKLSNEISNKNSTEFYLRSFRETQNLRKLNWVKNSNSVWNLSKNLSKNKKIFARLEKIISRLLFMLWSALQICDFWRTF